MLSHLAGATSSAVDLTRSPPSIMHPTMTWPNGTCSRQGVLVFTSLLNDVVMIAANKTADDLCFALDVLASMLCKRVSVRRRAAVPHSSITRPFVLLCSVRSLGSHYQGHCTLSRTRLGQQECVRDLITYCGYNLGTRCDAGRTTLQEMVLSRALYPSALEYRKLKEYPAPGLVQVRLAGTEGSSNSHISPMRSSPSAPSGIRVSSVWLCQSVEVCSMMWMRPGRSR